MTLELYTELKNEINQRVDKYSNILNSFDKNSAGMVDITPEFRLAKTNFNIAFKELQTINKAASKEIMKAYRLANRFNKITPKSISQRCNEIS